MDGTFAVESCTPSIKPPEEEEGGENQDEGYEGVGCFACLGRVIVFFYTPLSLHPPVSTSPLARYVFRARRAVSGGYCPLESPSLPLLLLPSCPLTHSFYPHPHLILLSLSLTSSSSLPLPHFLLSSGYTVLIRNASHFTLAVTGDGIEQTEVRLFRACTRMGLGGGVGVEREEREVL